MSATDSPQDILPLVSRRVVIGEVSPTVDQGRWPAKRVLGDRLRVEVDLLVDGHDLIDGRLLVRRPDEKIQELRLVAGEGDVYHATATLDAVGLWRYRVEAWVDRFGSWRHGLERKVGAQLDVALELEEGAKLVTAAARRAPLLKSAAAAIGDAHLPQAERVRAALDPGLAAAMRDSADREGATRSESAAGEWFAVTVDPVLARASAWYELFPRSAADGTRHGTFADVEARLPYLAELGFDVLYLPPIHPIGRAFRKGPNNTLSAGPDDPGSPWAIGAAEGGHLSVHPRLGRMEDFRRLVARAGQLGIHIALDIAFQASPDHPYVKEHPEWFIHRADGSIQYAENPPKRYQDVYPFRFDGPDSASLWEELRRIFLFWIDAGVTVFRVDNPHTKPLPFWEWCLASVKAQHPETIFLAEAFTRPKLMYALAKRGFSQSYTYFTWRSSKAELVEYATELTTVGEFFRANFWPNTPDILPEHLQYGGRATFISRLVLAATLSSNYGIYGPSFELMEHEARPDSEEYADSEKYQLRQWNLNDENSLAPVIRRLNRARRAEAALQDNLIHFHPTDNELVLCYSKVSRDRASVVLMVVLLDPKNAHSAWLSLDLDALGVDSEASFQVHDLLGDARFLWQGSRNFVRLDPSQMPAHLFRVSRRARSERSFDYFT